MLGESVLSPPVSPDMVRQMRILKILFIYIFLFTSTHAKICDLKNNIHTQSGAASHLSKDCNVWMTINVNQLEDIDKQKIKEIYAYCGWIDYTKSKYYEELLKKKYNTTYCLRAGDYEINQIKAYYKKTGVGKDYDTTCLKPGDKYIVQQSYVRIMESSSLLKNNKIKPTDLLYQKFKSEYLEKDGNEFCITKDDEYTNIDELTLNKLLQAAKDFREKRITESEFDRVKDDILKTL